METSFDFSVMQQFNLQASACEKRAQWSDLGAESGSLRFSMSDVFSESGLYMLIL